MSRLSLLIFFILTQLVVKSQSSDSSYVWNYIKEVESQIDSLEKARQFEIIEERLADAEQICLDSLGEEEPYCYYIHASRARNFYQQNNFQKADLYWKYAKDKLVQLNEYKGEKYITILNNLITSASAQGHYEEAGNYFEELSSLVLEQMGETSPAYVKLLTKQGILNFRLGKYEDTEQQFLEAIEIGKTVYGERHEKYGELLNNLAVIYKSLGRFDESTALPTLWPYLYSKSSIGLHPAYSADKRSVTASYIRFPISSAKTLATSPPPAICTNKLERLAMFEAV